VTSVGTKGRGGKVLLEQRARREDVRKKKSTSFKAIANISRRERGEMRTPTRQRQEDKHKVVDTRSKTRSLQKITNNTKQEEEGWKEKGGVSRWGVGTDDHQSKRPETV